MCLVRSSVEKFIPVPDREINLNRNCDYSEDRENCFEDKHIESSVFIFLLRAAAVLEVYIHQFFERSAVEHYVTLNIGILSEILVLSYYGHGLTKEFL